MEQNNLIANINSSISIREKYILGKQDIILKLIKQGKRDEARREYDELINSLTAQEKLRHGIINTFYDQINGIMQ